jgi:FSR family fosmidomycin resistance protein-like MFS transporter
MKIKCLVLTVYSFSHALVDAASIAAVMSLAYQKAHSSEALMLVLLYNFLAFATQPLLGILSDRFFKAERVSALGCIITAIGLMISFPYWSIALVGIGNALFHVGGGITSLNIDPGKAWAPGIFIAPGNIGVFIGILAAKTEFNHWLYILLLIIAAFSFIIIRLPDNTSLPEPNPISPKSSQNILYAALFLILITVIIRSFAGLTVQFQWKDNMTLLILLSICVTLGKAFGGVLSDKFGLLKVPVIGLMIAIPCIIIGFKIPVAGSIGMLLFNLTMPVTLILASNLLPQNKGFAFGLTVLALSIGSIPAYSGIRLTETLSISAAILTSVITLVSGYVLYKKIVYIKKEVSDL